MGISQQGGILIDIRILTTEEELRQSSRNSSIAFGFPITEDPENPPKTEPGRDMWGVFEEGKLISQICAISYQMMYHGSYVGMCGIGDVCSLVEYRNRGHIRALFEKILPANRKKGEVFSYLYPFSHAYYAKFGYSQAMSKVYVSFPPRKLAAYRCDCDIIRYEKGQDSAPYDTVFEAFAAQYTGMVKRKNWKRLDDYDPNKNTKVMYLLRKNGAPIAFIGYQPERKDEDRIMKVHDMAWVDIAAFKQLLGFINALRSHYEKISMGLPSDFQLEYMLENPYDVERKLGCSGQVRILNVQAALEKYPWPDRQGHVVIGVRDDLLEENSGTYRVEYGPAGCSVRKADCSPDLTLDIRALNPLLFGSVSFEELAYFPDDQVAVHGNERALSQAFTRRPIFITEYF